MIKLTFKKEKTMEIPTSFNEFLAWLISPAGGAFFVTFWALSWLLEDVDKWNKLTSKARQLIILGIAIVVGLAVVWLQTMPELVATIAPYVQAIVFIITAWVTSQFAHKLDKFVLK